MTPAGRLALISAALMVRGTISEINVRFPYPPGDQLCVLGPEVNDQNRVARRRGGW